MARYNFQAPSQSKGHVEIRSPTVRAAASASRGYSAADGFSELTKAYAEREMEKRAADPWSGLRDVSSPSPFAGLGQRIGRLFGL